MRKWWARMISLSLIAILSYSNIHTWTIDSVDAMDASIPRNNLSLELLFSGSLSDTSLWNRYIQSTWNISLNFDSGLQMPFAAFSGTGHLSTYLGWNASSSSPFTLSFWVKAPKEGRNNMWNPMYDCPKYWAGYKYYTSSDTLFDVFHWAFERISPPVLSAGCYKVYYESENFANTSKTLASTTSDDEVMQNVMYAKAKDGSNKWMYANYSKSGTWMTNVYRISPQTIFSFQKYASGALSSPTDLWIRLSKEYLCSIEGGSTSFDCTKLSDGGWHMITLRRNSSRTLWAFIDAKLITSWDNSLVTTTRNLNIGRSSTFDADATNFNGSLAYFRIFNTDLTDTQIALLLQEGGLSVQSADEPIISINQPNIEQESYKSISATSSTWSLFLATTTGSICNGTLTFDPYTSLVFSTIQDNGTRVCYKAVNGLKITYKLSNPIAWIVGTASDTTVDNIFGSYDTYKSWPFSVNARSDDYTYWILSTVKWTNFIDMNWDGLVDVLYNSNKSSLNSYLAIFINNGDYTFRPAYKCQLASSYQAINGTSYWSISGYYGDCADIKNYR